MQFYPKLPDMITTTAKPVTKAHSSMSTLNVKHQLKKTAEKTKEDSPSSVLQSMIGSSGKPLDDFRKPTEEDISSYDVEVVRVIRSQNMERLRELFAEGRSMNACNQFGESLVHMVCRRGDVKILKFMIEEAKVCFTIKDDFGRNPFHDACWTSTPNFEMMDMLIEAADTALLVSEDVRGNTPFDYARREHHAKWVAYLKTRKENLIKGLKREDNGTI